MADEVNDFSHDAKNSGDSDKKKAPEIEIDIDEWFSPFEGYDEIPYMHPEGSGYLEYKSIPVSVRNTKLRVSTVYVPEIDSSVPTSVFLPNKDMVLKEFEEPSEKIEAKVVSIMVDSEQKENLPLPYEVIVKSPVGNMYTGRQPIEQIPGGGGYMFQFSNDNTSLGLAAPETEFILGKIEFKVVPIEITQK